MSNKGFALPTVLGIFVFVTSLAAGLFILVMNTTLLVARDIEISEEDFTARNNLTVFLDVVEDQGEINEVLLEILNLQQEQISSTVTRIYYTKSDGQEIQGHVVFSGDEFNDTIRDFIENDEVVTTTVVEIGQGNIHLLWIFFIGLLISP